LVTFGAVTALYHGAAVPRVPVGFSTPMVTTWETI